MAARLSEDRTQSSVDQVEATATKRPSAPHYWHRRRRSNTFQLSLPNLIVYLTFANSLMHLAGNFEAVYPFIYDLYKILRKSGTLIYNCWHLLICGVEVWFGKYPLIRGLDYLAGLNLTWPDLASSRVKEVPLQPRLLPGSCLFPIYSLHLTPFSIQSHPNTSHMLVSHLRWSARLAGLEITKLCRKTEHFRPHHPCSTIFLVVLYSFMKVCWHSP